MKMRTFTTRVFFHEVEKELNEFLATLENGAVKHVNTAMAATRTGDSDQMETEYAVTVWYED